MNERDYLLMNLNTTLDRLQRENIKLKEQRDSIFDLMDYYIGHYAEKGHKDTTLKLKDILEDMENVLEVD